MIPFDVTPYIPPPPSQNPITSITLGKEQYSRYSLDYKNVSTDIQEKFISLQRRVKSFASLQYDWDTYGGNAPSGLAIDNALYALNAFNQVYILPEHIKASGDDSIILEVTRNHKYHLLEFFNDGEIVYLSKNLDHSDRQIMDIDKESLPQIIASL
jgi:hypothetical protein